MTSQLASMAPLAVAARLALALSLWQAPIPWAHLHWTSEAGDPIASDAALSGIFGFSRAFLAEHIQRFHGGDPRACRLGWHWHLTRLGPETSEEHESSVPAPKPLIVAVASEAAQSADHALQSPFDAAWFSPVVETTLDDAPRHLSDAGIPLLRSAQQTLCRLRC